MDDCNCSICVGAKTWDYIEKAYLVNEKILKEVDLVEKTYLTEDGDLYTIIKEL